MRLGAAAFVSKRQAGSAVVAALMQALTHGKEAHSKAAHGKDAAAVQALPAADPDVGHQTDPDMSTLTARQLDVLLMLDQGLTNRDISLQLGLSEKTVKNHVFSLCAALGVTSRLHALRKARDSGLLKN